MVSFLKNAILRKRQLVYLTAVTSYCLLGFLSAFWLSRDSSGYRASFGFIILVFLFGGLIILLCIVGGVLLLFSETRWSAPALLLSCVLIPASYFISLKTLSYFGLVRYEHEQMTPLGSNLPKGLAIVFKKEVSEEQIEQFVKELIDKPREDMNGTSLVSGLCYFGRHSPKGHKTVEVRFCLSTSEEQRKSLKDKVVSIPIVFKVFDDVSASDIDPKDLAIPD